MLERDGKLGTVDNLNGWELVVPSSPRALPTPPITFGAAGSERTQQLRVHTEDVEYALGPPATVRGQSYYWSAPLEYLGKQLTAYRGELEAITRFGSPSARPGMTGGGSHQDDYELSRVWINEPDVVIEVRLKLVPFYFTKKAKLSVNQK